MVLERRDFANDLPAGPDWIVPLPAHASSFAERAKGAPVPEFPAGAKVKVERVKGTNRAKKETEQFVVTFPNVKGLADGARAFDFQVMVEAEDVDRGKVWMTKRVYSPHYYWAAARARNCLRPTRWWLSAGGASALPFRPPTASADTARPSAQTG